MPPNQVICNKCKKRVAFYENSDGRFYCACCKRSARFIPERARDILGLYRAMWDMCMSTPHEEHKRRKSLRSFLNTFNVFAKDIPLQVYDERTGRALPRCCYCRKRFGLRAPKKKGRKLFCQECEASVNIKSKPLLEHIGAALNLVERCADDKGLLDTPDLFRALEATVDLRGLEHMRALLRHAQPPE